MSYFFTSDTHFDHANIIPLAKRPFPYDVWLHNGKKEYVVPPESVEEMNETMIHEWNLKVKPHDIVYHLGDFAVKSTREKTLTILERLNGGIILISGNHEGDAHKLRSKFLSVSDYREVTIGEQKIVLFHYPIRSWNGIFKGSWHLHGHTHTLLPSFGKSFDIGVDKWNFQPLSFEEVALEMGKLPYKSEEEGFPGYIPLKERFDGGNEGN